MKYMTSLLVFRNFWRILLCAAAIVVSAAASAHDAPPPPQPVSMVPGDSTALEVAAMAIDAFHAALVKGDRDAALALLAENIQIYEQGWVERSKAEYAAHHLGSDMKFSAAVSSAQTARSGVGVGDMAYVTTEKRMTGKFNDKNIDSISLETVVLRRIEGSWRIAHIHWSSRDAKK
jgi:ketosteroid isomerase-like protein